MIAKRRYQSFYKDMVAFGCFHTVDGRHMKAVVVNWIPSKVLTSIQYLQKKKKFLTSTKFVKFHNLFAKGYKLLVKVYKLFPNICKNFHQAYKVLEAVHEVS